jgi:hypothetical protein
LQDEAGKKIHKNAKQKSEHLKIPSVDNLLAKKTVSCVIKWRYLSFGRYWYRIICTVGRK